MASDAEVFVEILADTENAILVQRDPDIWIPRSQIDPDESELDREACGEGDKGNIVIPEWLAMNEGLI